MIDERPDQDAGNESPVPEPTAQQAAGQPEGDPSADVAETRAETREINLSIPSREDPPEE